MVEWRHQLNGCESEHTPEDREGQENLENSSARGRKRTKHDWVTEQQKHLGRGHWDANKSLSREKRGPLPGDLD